MRTKPNAAENEGMSTILVVDDEPIVRDVVVRYLRRDGFATLEAGTGEEAMAAARARTAGARRSGRDASRNGRPRGLSAHPRDLRSSDRAAHRARRRGGSHRRPRARRRRLRDEAVLAARARGPRAKSPAALVARSRGPVPSDRVRLGRGRRVSPRSAARRRTTEADARRNSTYSGFSSRIHAACSRVTS